MSRIADEQVFTGQFRHDAELLAALLVSAGKAVKNKDFAVLQIGRHLVFQGAELVLCDRAVDAAPGDEVVDPRRIDDEFILCARPVNFPVFTTSAPVSLSTPSPRRSAASVRHAGLRLRYTADGLMIPVRSSPNVSIQNPPKCNNR